MPDDLTGKSVLIVDDEPLIRDLFEHEFKDFNADVSLAESGEAALTLLNAKKFDIVLTDMKMPNGDGMWLISKINEELDQTPHIYLCSGYNDYSNEHLKALGIIEVFPKPFDFTAIISIIIENIQKEKT